MITTKVIHINDYDIQDVQDMCNDLSEELRKIGVKLDLSETTSTLYISYEAIDVHYRLKRNAGLRCFNATSHTISASECRNRMRAGESAAQLAEEYGISRATLFRKLKAAEKKGTDQIIL